MNDSQKHSKVEMEILSHEKAMMHAGQIRILNEGGSLTEKINYIKSLDTKKTWTADEVMAKLSSEGLNDGSIKKEDVEKEMGK